MRYSIASCVVLAAALTNASVLDKRADCQAQANSCRTAPDANQSFCSAQLSQCLGYNPYGNNTATTNSSPSNPQESCQAIADQCRTKPNANQATCSAQLAACLGYNPYANNTKPVWVTEVVTKFTTYCPEATTFVYNHKSYTAKKNETLTIVDCPCTITRPINPAPKPTSSPSDCEKAVNECRTKPNANQSLCSAQLAQCLGNNPYAAQSQPGGAANTLVPATKAGSQPQATRPSAPGQGTPGSSTGTPKSQPGSPAAGSPGSPAAGSPGNPATGAPGNPAAGASGNPAADAPGNPASGAPGNPAAGASGNPAAGAPGNPAAGTPGNPAATYTGPVANVPASTPTGQEQFTGAASLNEPVVGLLALAIGVIAAL